MRAWSRFVPVALALFLSGTGCSFAMHKSSPAEYGGGVRVAPGFPVGQGGITLHPTASFTYLDGDGWHDELYEFGGQIRRTLSRTASGSPGVWLGSEASFAVLREVWSGGSGSHNGWSFNALLGVPVGTSKWGLNLYTAAGVCDYGAHGFNVRAGVDLQPWFLKR
jgi:hypothetical protein